MVCGDNTYNNGLLRNINSNYFGNGIIDLLKTQGGSVKVQDKLQLAKNEIRLDSATNGSKV